MSELFSGDPIPQDQSCGWQERQDALHKRPGLPMPGPWTWEIHDHSAATLCGGGEDAIIGHILTVNPCEACAKRAEPKEWQWGRCMTPSIENARLIAAAPDMLAALHNVRKLISEAAMTGFNWKDGDWADRLFASQATTTAAIEKAEGHRRVAVAASAQLIEH